MNGDYGGKTFLEESRDSARMLGIAMGIGLVAVAVIVTIVVVLIVT